MSHLELYGVHDDGDVLRDNGLRVEFSAIERSSRLVVLVAQLLLQRKLHTRQNLHTPHALPRPHRAGHHRTEHKHQLSLIDPRDSIVLWTQLDDLINSVVECRSSEVLST